MERLHPLVILESLEDLRVDPGLAHHLRVRRVRNGDRLVLCDGQGAVQAVTVRARGEGFEFAPLEEIRRLPRPAPPVQVATFLPSHERLAWEIHKLTEVGVDEIWLLSEPTDRRGGQGLSRSGLARLERIAREASMQSERSFVPVLHPPCRVSEFLARTDGNVAVLDPAGGELPDGTTALIVGPESGHVPVPPELPRVRLPTGLLRIETAAIIAAFILVAKRAGVADGL